MSYKTSRRQLTECLVQCNHYSTLISLDNIVLKLSLQLRLSRYIHAISSLARTHCETRIHVADSVQMIGRGSSLRGDESQPDTRSLSSSSTHLSQVQPARQKLDRSCDEATPTIVSYVPIGR